LKQILTRAVLTFNGGCGVAFDRALGE